MVGRLGSRVEETVRRGSKLGSAWQSSPSVCGPSTACQASGRAELANGSSETNVRRQDRLPVDHHASARSSGFLCSVSARKALSRQLSVRCAAPIAFARLFNPHQLAARPGHSWAEGTCGLREEDAEDLTEGRRLVPAPPAAFL